MDTTNDQIEVDELFRAIVAFIVRSHDLALQGHRPALAEQREQRERFDALSAWTDSGRAIPAAIFSGGMRFRWNPAQQSVESMPA